MVNVEIIKARLALLSEYVQDLEAERTVSLTITSKLLQSES